MKSKVLPLFILSAAWAGLQAIDLKCLKNKEPSDWCYFLNFLDDKKIPIIWILIVGFTIYNLHIHNQERKRTENQIRSFLYLFFKSDLDEDKNNHRITIFKIKSGFSLFLMYIWNTISRIGYYSKCGKLRTRMIKTPLPVFWIKYLCVHSRYGLPNETYKATVFRLGKNESSIDCFAVHTYHQGQNQSVKLPDIRKINLKNSRNLKQLLASHQSKVKDYMRKSKIQSFHTLKILGRTPIYLGAIPLFTKKKNLRYPTHIIMYDSNKKSFNNIEDKLVEISKYFEIILS